MFEEIQKNRRYDYARVSSKSQEDNSSLEAQKQEFLKLGVPEKNLRCEVLSFKSEKIEVDYITLNISIEGHIDPKGIGEFLFEY